MENLYCSMIHGGLTMSFKSQETLAQHCCLRPSMFFVDVSTNFWNDPGFVELREYNKTNQWHPGCANCSQLERANSHSFRQGMNDGLQIQGQTDLSGPVRIDLMFDISCNLACRTCGPGSSTFWQKQLKQHNLWLEPISTPRSKEQVIDALKQLDLSNLRQLVFCGGETLLGNEYWAVADWLGDNVPNAKQQLTLCFQTNGTQTISPAKHSVIEKFHLVKLHVSLDGVAEQFEYLRWPATWQQVTDNLIDLKNTLPSNVMFVVEETISIFNLAYIDRLDAWIKQNFTANHEGDVINHTQHLATGVFSLEHCSQEYVDAMQTTPHGNLIPGGWSESADKIKTMIEQIQQFDTYRNESFARTFPEVASYYARFL